MSSTVQDSVAQNASINLTDILSGDYASGSNSIAGLGNGTDFTSMINQLKKIELIPTQRMLRWKSDWLERKSAFQIVREAMVQLRDVCNKMNTMDRFLVKKATSSMSQYATATASSGAIDNSYKLEIDQVATTSIWSLNNEFVDAKTNINSGAQTTFSYEYAGTTRTLAIPPNTSLENLKNMINNDASNPGVRASLIKSANGVTFQIKGMDQGEKNNLTILASDGLTGFPGTADYPPHQVQYSTSYDTPTDIINTTSSNKTFSYTFNGVRENITIPPNATLSDLLGSINANHGGALSASLSEAGTPPKQVITFTSSTAGDVIEMPKSSEWEDFGAPKTISADPTGWHIQASQNAKIKIDGWPSGAGNWLEVDSNTVSDVVEGVTFTLIGEGTTTLSVTTDAEAVQENVVEFIEAINNFRMTINELTKYDNNKTTYDVKDAESLYEMQKGSILTGNYGVQLISSRMKQATAGSPLGFLPRTQVGDLFMGDLYTSLSQLGIKTNATGEGGDTFGLLELNTDPNLPMLDDILKKNPDAVADFFAAFNKGVSDSSHFSYSSSMQNITRPGAFEVKYDIDSNGKVIDGTASINGKAAKYYEDTGQLGLLRTPPTSDNGGAVTATTEGLMDFTAEVEVTQLAKNSSTTVGTDLTSKDASFVENSGTFSYTYNGQQYDIQATAGDSLDMIKLKINYNINNPGVRAEVVEDGGTWSLKISSNKEGASGDTLYADLSGFTVAGAAGICSLGSEAGQNAEFKVTTGGQTYTVTDQKTNNVSIPQLEGVTFDLKKVTSGDTPPTVKIEGLHHNDADGIYVQIDNHSQGSYTGTVRIKQGKINEILEMLNGTASKPEEGMLGSKGALQVLMDNYDRIVQGIDGKIQRETERITRWERTQKLRFARLEATLKQYESLQASIDSQVKQLSGNSS